MSALVTAAIGAARSLASLSPRTCRSPARTWPATSSRCRRRGDGPLRLLSGTRRRGQGRGASTTWDGCCRVRDGVRRRDAALVKLGNVGAVTFVILAHADAGWLVVVFADSRRCSSTRSSACLSSRRADRATASGTRAAHAPSVPLLLLAHLLPLKLGARPRSTVPRSSWAASRALLQRGRGIRPHHLVAVPVPLARHHARRAPHIFASVRSWPPASRVCAGSAPRPPT